MSNEYLIYYRTKDNDLFYEWWNGETLESAIDSAEYDLQNNGVVDVEYTKQRTIEEILLKEYQLTEEEVEEATEDLVYRIQVSVEGLEESIKEYMDR